MNGAARGIVLTAELVAQAHPPRAGDASPAMRRLSDSYIEASLEQTLAARPPRARGLWLFAYGSLLWHPELDFSARRIALVRGWHRRFCLWQWGFRGSRERPCLMLALDAGGACRGLLYRITEPVAGKVRAVWRRELGADGYRPRWVTAATDRGPVRAVTFVANRAGERYAGRLPDAIVAGHVAGACGPKGACADYLRRAVESLAALGIRDARLWRLQRMVAATMSANRAGAGVGVAPADRRAGAMR